LCIPAAIVSGGVLAIIVLVIVPGLGFNEFSLARWLHILSGIMWIGLLYYVNAKPRSTPRARTSFSRSPCCSAWARRATACRSDRRPRASTTSLSGGVVLELPHDRAGTLDHTRDENFAVRGGCSARIAHDARRG
jgi:hypothetical protein